MKKLFFTIALLVQTTLLFAAGNNGTLTAVVLYDNVKMYRQAGTSTEVVKALKDRMN